MESVGRTQQRDLEVVSVGLDAVVVLGVGLGAAHEIRGRGLFQRFARLVETTRR